MNKQKTHFYFWLIDSTFMLSNVQVNAQVNLKKMLTKDQITTPNIDT